MPKIANNAEVLRGLGHFLDEQRATTFDIVNHLAYLAVTWDAPDTGSNRGQRAYQENDLLTLGAAGRAMREGSEAPVGSLVELLRTLGQEMDLEGVDVSSIRRDNHSFHVSGELDGKHYQSQYLTKHLVAIAAARRGARGKPSQVLPSPARRPSPRREQAPQLFLGVAMGARVYAEDGEFIGEVVDLRNRYFKVAKPREEGCWLPAESVGSVTRAGDILLSPLGSDA